jgi:hypothetical protein
MLLLSRDVLVLSEIKVVLDLVLQTLVRVLMKLSHYTLGSSGLAAVLLVMGLGLSLLAEIVAVVPVESILVVMLLGTTSPSAGLEGLGAEALVKVILLASLGSRALVVLSFLFDTVAFRFRFWLLRSLGRLSLIGGGNDRGVQECGVGWSDDLEVSDEF